MKTRIRTVSSPSLAALRDVGTRHVYGDTADPVELRHLLARGDGALVREVDGNTANQPLVRKVLARLLDEVGPLAHSLGEPPVAGATQGDHLPWLYAMLCARIGNAMAHELAGGRSWDTSLQIHMELCASREDAVRVGRVVHERAPGSLIKIPFTPEYPHCLIVARELQEAGVPVNVTSTFSARQVAVVALLTNASRTNVFMGRIEEGLEAERLGERVVLAAQRQLSSLRALEETTTELIVASMRDWRSFFPLAGCDAFTAPCDVLGDLLRDDEGHAEELRNRRGSPLEPEVSERVRGRVGPEALERLSLVEPELLEFLRDLVRPKRPRLVDGDELFSRFDEAGFGDLFHVPTDDERAEARAGKLPDLDGELLGRIALDTHYSLLANEDFRKHQEAIDAEIREHLESGG